MLPESPYREKVSREFAERLRRADKDQLIRAVLMLQTPGLENPSPREARRARRVRAIERKRGSADSALPELDAVLSKHGGRRLASVSLLGTVPVETTPAGVDALAALGSVTSIMEDQPVRLIE